MYERYTADARRAVVLAQEEARALGHPAVEPEHLLLGVLGVDDGSPAQALGGLGLSLDRGRSEVEDVLGRGAGAPHGSLPFTPRAREAVQQALREAMALGHEEIDGEHVVLALLAARDGVAARVLGGVAHEGAVREALLAGMGAASAGAPTAGPAVADVPAAVTVRVGDDVRRLLRRAAAHALSDDAAELSVDHVRRALE